MHTTNTTHINGMLAGQMGFHLPLQVLRSAAGYYIGTFSNEEGSVSRESAEYFTTTDEANHALNTGAWTQRSSL